MKRSRPVPITPVRPDGFSNADRNADEWALRGTNLDPKKVTALQRKLCGDPHDLEARITLLGYLSRRRFSDLKDPCYCEHALWLVRNLPHLRFSGSPWLVVHKDMDPCFRKMESTWDRHRRKFPRDCMVLRNAARFYSGAGRLGKAETLYRKLQGLEPGNPRWHEDLAFMYYLHGRWRGSRWRRHWAEKAFREYAKVEHKSNFKQRYHLLSHMAETAFDAEKFIPASRYSTRLLSEAKKHKGTWSYGNAIHHGHTVLGLVSLAQGRVLKALRHLTASCRGVDSPQLMSFGPSTRLAEALLAHGRTEEVVDFLDRCTAFWRMDDGSLRRWTDDIKAGRQVDFMVRFDLERAKK